MYTRPLSSTSCFSFPPHLLLLAKEEKWAEQGQKWLTADDWPPWWILSVPASFIHPSIPVTCVYWVHNATYLSYLYLCQGG